MKKNDSITIDLDFLDYIFIVLAILKCLGVISTSWLVITGFLWFPAVINIILNVFVWMVIKVSGLDKKVSSKKSKKHEKE